MKLKHITLIITLISFLGFYGQNKTLKTPNYKKIKRNIKKSNSKFFYPKLLSNYFKGNNNMSLPEKRYLYYGFTFHDNYKPYTESLQKGTIKKLFLKGNHTNKEFKELIKISDFYLFNNPFDIEIINLQIFILKKLRLLEKAEKKLNQKDIIIDAILSTGNGETKLNAYHVIMTAHENDVLTNLNLKQKGRHLSTDIYEYLNLENNDKNIKGLFFNINQSIKSVNHK
jgi:hypothetical protein